MKGERKAKEQLTSELVELRRRVTELEAADKERTRAEKALRESEERYRTLSEGVPVGLYRTTPGGQIVGGNPALVQMLGYPDLESLLGLNVTDRHVNVGDRGRWQALMEREGIVRNFEAQWHRRDGTIIWVEESARSVRDGKGRLLCYEGALVDITERKRAEDALREYSERLEEMVEERTKELHDAQEQLVRREKLAALGQLAGGLAHELNNPLTGVLMYARRLLKKVQEEPLASNPALRTFPESLRVIEEAAVRCRDVVSDLLTFARQDWVEFSPLQVNEVVEAALRPMKAQLSNGGVSLRLDLQPDLPPVIGNANQLRQVFTNLILNAQQAMPEGGELTISTRLLDSRRLHVQVRDSGCGMPEEIRSRIFEPFFTTRPVGQGTGLGLSASHRIIEAHKGSIDVESTAGAGTTFTIALPITEEWADA